MIYHADCRSIPLPDGCVQCVITSPPYYGLRDYGTATWEGGDAACNHDQRRLSSETSKQITSAGTSRDPFRGGDCRWCGAKRIDAQIGLEATPEAYLDTMVAVFREIRRVLRDDGTVWLNIGDSYASDTKGTGGVSHSSSFHETTGVVKGQRFESRKFNHGLKPKDLMGMPWRLAFALQADGWYLRSDIIWAKPNPMPESVLDRPTRSHEHVFLLTKRSSYYYDSDAIREVQQSAERSEFYDPDNMPTVKTPTWGMGGSQSLKDKGRAPRLLNPAGRNKRDVWTIPSQATPEAHFATFPEKLVEPCVLAGTSAKGCCSECGAPYVRETESEIIYDRPGVYGKKYNFEKAYGNQAANRIADGHRHGAKSVETVGWRATCTHDAAIQPCLVFDPFLGSGTVGVVCERLGRRWAGTELSEAYIEIARKRTCQQGLFSHAIAN